MGSFVRGFVGGLVVLVGLAVLIGVGFFAGGLTMITMEHNGFSHNVSGFSGIGVMIVFVVCIMAGLFEVANG